MRLYTLYHGTESRGHAFFFSFFLP